MNILTIHIDTFGIWRLSIFFGMITFLFLFIFENFKKTKIIFGLFWFYVIAYCLYFVEFPSIPYGDYTKAFMSTSGQTLAECILIPLVVFKTNDEIYEKIFIGFLNFFVIYEILSTWFGGYTFFIAGSFDMAFLAACLPLCPSWIAAASIVTILTHHGTTACVILAAQAFLYAIKNSPKILFGLPILGIAAYFNKIGPWERIHAYERYMSFWWEQGATIKTFGFGPGSFIWFSMMIDNFKPPIFFQMHSDWLQIFFELGIIGGSFAILCFIKAIKDSWNNPRILYSIAGYGAFALTYHPLRFFPSMILGAFIFFKSINPKRN